MDQTEHVLDEGLRALKEHAGSREGSATPQREASTGAETPGRVEEIVGLPPSPPGQCSEEVEARFAQCFERKAHGANYNDQIKLRKDFKNPAIYEVLVQKFNLDEKGSNFPESVYDPHAFSEGDFYEALAEEQRKLTENAQAAAASSSKPKKKTRFGA
ncbi:transcriptional regulator HCNGP [Aphelenchoides avenae]|nr:transcriptional regulator HCNGP [Aphelenchus avenae]